MTRSWYSKSMDSMHGQLPHDVLWSKLELQAEHLPTSTRFTESNSPRGTKTPFAESCPYRGKPMRFVFNAGFYRLKRIRVFCGEVLLLSDIYIYIDPCMDGHLSDTPLKFYLTQPHSPWKMILYLWYGQIAGATLALGRVYNGFNSVYRARQDDIMHTWL